MMVAMGEAPEVPSPAAAVIARRASRAGPSPQTFFNSEVVVGFFATRSCSVRSGKTYRAGAPVWWQSGLSAAQHRA